MSLLLILESVAHAEEIGLHPPKSGTIPTSRPVIITLLLMIAVSTGGDDRATPGLQQS